MEVCVQVKFYVTKWVIARGILHVEGTKPVKHHPRMKNLHTRVDVPGWRSSYPLRVGADAFLSLKEAEEDARERFAVHLKKMRREYTYAKRAAQLIQAGKGPVIHHAPLHVKNCHAFSSRLSTFLGPQSG